MHFKRKRHSGRAVLAVFLVLALLAAVCYAVWLFRDDLAGLFDSKKKPATDAPQGAVIGILLATQEVDDFAQQAQQAEQKAFLDAFVNDAAQHGMNAVFVDMMQGSGKTATVFGRDRAYATMKNVAQNDEFFQKFDAMKYLCAAAHKQNLAVYAVFPQAGADTDKALQKAVKRAVKKYHLADAYYKADSTAALGTLTSATDGSTLPYTAAGAWTQPSAVFLQTLAADYKGIVIDDYASAQRFPDAFVLMASALHNSAPAPVLLSYTQEPTLAVTYPAADAKIYTGKCFLMGTSDPAQPLTINGTEVPRTGKTGVFGVLVELAEGENIFTFVQGEAQLPFVVNRLQSTWTGGGGVKHDGTQSVPPGSKVAVSGWIASLLYDPGDDGKISETVRMGGVATVADCVETMRSGKKTWAYQLTSGDYILAYNTKYLGTDVPTPAFTGATAEKTDKGETLTFAGSGTPMAYTNAQGNNLILHCYDTNFAPNFAVTGSDMVKSVQVNAIENGGTELVFQFAAPLYGHSVEYADGTLRLLLKRTPVRSTADFAKPLAGVSVLLDPGHGADDTGAMGVAGRNAPQEKDVNLAVSLAAKYRLEQLGATVFMIRADDTFLTLVERNQKIAELSPDFFIAVHHNSVELTVDANAAAGTECYYFYDAGKPLAEALVQNVVAATGRPNRGALWGYYYVTRSTLCPAVLMECGFMVNPAEYEDVVNVQTIWKEGDAIATAVLSGVGAA
ncbi:MAG: N-acetylmuramoyl-L-alanine amidase [Ruthenibacterium sp.]